MTVEQYIFNLVTNPSFVIDMVPLGDKGNMQSLEWRKGPLFEGLRAHMCFTYENANSFEEQRGMTRTSVCWKSYTNNH